MKTLLIHSEDDPERGPWTTAGWDRVVDLGLGGAGSYARWRDRFRCPVTTLGSLRNGFQDFREVRDILGRGCGRVIDESGLDWWEILSILLHEELETLLLLKRFADSVGANDEVVVSRPGQHANILQCILGARARVFPFRRGTGKNGIAHYARVSSRLSLSQAIDVVCDKYDSGYKIRRLFARRSRPSRTPVVLVPSAYVSVSRTGFAYGKTFPDENFLLIATRRSGWVKNAPPNVAAAWLSSYVAATERNDEHDALERRWSALLYELTRTAEFGILNRLGSLDDFPQRFRNALRVRDAWRSVLDTEPVQAVLCSDDSNPYTRIPLLLARERAIPNIACHHGALDCRYIFKRSYGDVIWVKGKMEEDYLVRKCEVPRERIEIAAPALPASWIAIQKQDRLQFKSHILFLSEASEISGGRPEEFYRDVLPGLADLASSTGRKLIVKLHPSESKRERAKMLDGILSVQQKSITQIVSGPLTEDLLAGAWFGITMLSTVAVECAIRGIPCFLCKWLEFWPYGYIEQFIRFGVGIALNSPGEIEKIPDYLKVYSPVEEIVQNCWQAADSGRLRELVTASHSDYITGALKVG